MAYEAFDYFLWPTTGPTEAPYITHHESLEDNQAVCACLHHKHNSKGQNENFYFHTTWHYDSVLWIWSFYLYCSLNLISLWHCIVTSWKQNSTVSLEVSGGIHWTFSIGDLGHLMNFSCFTHHWAASIRMKGAQLQFSSSRMLTMSPSLPFLVVLVSPYNT